MSKERWKVSNKERLSVLKKAVDGKTRWETGSLFYGHFAVELSCGFVEDLVEIGRIWRLLVELSPRPTAPNPTPGGTCWFCGRTRCALYFYDFYLFSHVRVSSRELLSVYGICSCSNCFNGTEHIFGATAVL